MRRSLLLLDLLLGLLLGLLPALASAKKPPAAKEVVDKVNVDLKKQLADTATAEWIRATFTTDDTERNAAFFNERMLGYQAAAIKDAAPYVGAKTDADT